MLSKFYHRNANRRNDIDCNVIRDFIHLTPPRRTRVFATILVSMAAAVFGLSAVGCRNKRVDLRALTPADTLIYLETNDVRTSLAAISESKNFKKHSQSSPDFSMFDGVQLSIAITDFEAAEESLTQDESILNLKPRFVAIAETHAWDWQVRAVVENNIRPFVEQGYSESTSPKRRMQDKADWYIWKTPQNGKIIAAISGSQIFFGNDEDSVSRALSAKNGDGKSLLDNNELNGSNRDVEGDLAYGFVSRAGIEKLAGLFGVAVALAQTDDDDSRSIVSALIPALLRNTVQEISWRARKGQDGIEDDVSLKLDEKSSKIFSETVRPSAGSSTDLESFLPSAIYSTTHYSLENPQIAYRSLVLVGAQNADSLNGKLIGAISNSFLGAYGVADAEGFLDSIESEFFTVQIDESGENTIAVFTAKDIEKLKSSLIKELGIGSIPTDEFGARIWSTESDEFSAALIDDNVLIGDSETLRNVLDARSRGVRLTNEKSAGDKSGGLFRSMMNSGAVSSTLRSEHTSAGNLVKILGEPRTAAKAEFSDALTETRFTKNGIDRKYTSEFGMIGFLIEQFGAAFEAE